MNNMQEELGFADKADPRRGWTPAELNSILQNPRGEGSEWLCLDHIRLCGMGV